MRLLLPNIGLKENHNPTAHELLSTNNPNIELRCGMFEHAQKPEVLRDIFADESMQLSFGIDHEMLEDNNTFEQLREEI